MGNGECFYKEHERAFHSLKELLVMVKMYHQKEYSQEDYSSLAGNIRSVASSIAQCGRGDCIDKVMLLVEQAFDDGKLPIEHQLDVLLDVVDKQSKLLDITPEKVRSYEEKLREAGLNVAVFSEKL